jgi:hypothetical protein
MTAKFEEHEQTILKCVDDELGILGMDGRKAVYSCLKNKIGLKKNEIPRKPQVFCKGLTLVLGEKGADALEKQITDHLITIFELKRRPNTTFVETVDMIKRRKKGNIRTS